MGTLREESACLTWAPCALCAGWDTTAHGPSEHGTAVSFYRLTVSTRNDMIHVSGRPHQRLAFTGLLMVPAMPARVPGPPTGGTPMLMAQ